MRAVLLAAALEAGNPEAKAQATIASGLQVGRPSPAGAGMVRRELGLLLVGRPGRAVLLAPRRFEADGQHSLLGSHLRPGAPSTWSRIGSGCPPRGQLGLSIAPPAPPALQVADDPGPRRRQSNPPPDRSPRPPRCLWVQLLLGREVVVHRLLDSRAAAAAPGRRTGQLSCWILLADWPRTAPTLDQHLGGHPSPSLISLAGSARSDRVWSSSLGPRSERTLQAPTFLARGVKGMRRGRCL